MSRHITAFISGHRNITAEEFAAYYVPQFLAALSEGIEHFVVGDYYGVDILAQEYLAKHHPTVRVTVYHMFTSPRNALAHYPTIGGFQSDEERDAAMTQASIRDIAWIRPGKEKSGTAQNLARRLNRLTQPAQS